LHFHAALEEPAKAFARQNFEALTLTFHGKSTLQTNPLKDIDAIIVNAAGCGAMLKDYGHLFHGASESEVATAFAKKVKDISEFLIDLGPVKPTHPMKLKAVYHDACHLCHGQQIRKQPRHLLELIPELQMVPLNESEICCGAAGSYNLTQPEMADRLGERKAKNLLETGADAIFAGNVGCLIQIGRHLRATKPNLYIAHPIDALWASYRGDTVS
jgi:glycolate oxidase iron-sulfur subunit